MLSPLLGTISNSHIRNSGDLLNKINNLNMENKSLASLDIKSLYTNISVKKYIRRLEIHLKKTNITFPLPIHKIIKICPYNTKHRCFFLFNITVVCINKNLVFSKFYQFVKFLRAFSLNFYNLVAVNLYHLSILTVSARQEIYYSYMHRMITYQKLWIVKQYLNYDRFYS